MNRLFWGIALLVLVAGTGWSQSTWRGQAEIWTVGAPTDGFVAASNEFPRNSLLSVENYKTRKTIQVRVVAGLPSGATALVLLSAKAAQALEIKAGEIPLVGVRLDPAGIDRPDNPDPDVNPLAGKTVPLTTAPVAAVPPSAVTPATPVAKAVEAPAPTLAPEAKDTTARTPAVSSLDVARASTALDPDLLPLPALAAPEPVAEPAERVPLAVSNDAEAATPVTPGRKVFVTTRDPEPVALEVPAVTEAPAVAETPVAVPEVVEAPEPAAEPESAVAPAVTTALAEAPVEAPAAATPVPEPETKPAEVVAAPETPVVPETATEPVAAEPAVAEAPPAVTSPLAVTVPLAAPEPVAAPEPAATPATTAPVVPVEPVVPAAPRPALAVVPPKAAPASSWVSVPGKLEGPILGSVPLLAGLEKGRSYVQLGAWNSEADVLAVLGTVKSYVPLALYRAEGEKNPWRVVVASAPKGQLGVLLMHYRSQGFRTAAMVKG